MNWHDFDTGPNTSESNSQFPRTAQAEGYQRYTQGNLAPQNNSD
jgi:hypothetical protein